MAKKYKEANALPEGWAAGLAPGTVGAVHELMVCVDLAKRGFGVFRSVSPNCECDLLGIVNGRTFRIEVTTGLRSPTGRLFHGQKDGAKFDLLVIVEKSGNILYNPPLGELLSSLEEDGLVEFTQSGQIVDPDTAERPSTSKVT